ncbi:MAG TPA: hypothetical protein PLI09_09585 [Candidatus Hydrogenedentes bacterium]|nr:hypothetical protein [Candidatus Hydrogenedentota bacterium]
MKRYLTGIDWIVHSLDYAGKSQCGVGNASEIVLELNGRPDAEELQTALVGFLQKFPVVNGVPSRALNLCPYWKIPAPGKMLPIHVTTRHLEETDDPSLSMTAQVNTPFENKRTHLAFYLLDTPERAFLCMTFDHRLMDARGAEAFLALFQRYYEKNDLPQVVLEEPSHLDHWKENFLAGQQVNRFFLGLSKDKPRILPLQTHSRDCRFLSASFDAVQSARIVEIAYEQAGYLMLMPFLLAKTIQVMHRIVDSRNTEGPAYLVPVSVDTRPQDTVNKEIFFNYVSFFFFRAGVESAGDFPVLLENIKQQMYGQVSAKLPEALTKASLLLRIAPLPMVNFFLRRMSNKSFASFSFSFVGSAYDLPNFMRGEVHNILHFPRVPNPPGIGVFFTQFKGKLNVTLSYFDGMLCNDEALQIIAELKAIANAA